MRWEKWCVCSLLVQAIGWGQRGEQAHETAWLLFWTCWWACCASEAMHQTRHGHLGVDCDISCLLWGKDPGSRGLISAQAPYRFITLAVSLNILPYMSHILKHLLDMGLGCCHNILNQIREVMLTSVTRQRLACLGCYLSSSLECERVKKLPETLLLLRQEN